MFGLTRIIQIDGFIQGKRTVIELDDHSIVNGTNGAGKTSTLKLLAVFYGADPNTLDKHAAGRAPFTHWYLPRDTSLMIFEYEREDGKHCVVLYRKNQDKYVYRFLKASYQESFFSQENNGELTYLKGDELKTHWTGLDLECSSQIETIVDYKAIIQNDKQQINRLNERRSKLRKLANEYCLGSSNTHMRHIERVCTAIMSRSGNMERMKEMLAHIMHSDGVRFPESKNHNANAKLAGEVRALMAFDKRLPTLREISSMHQERLQLETSLKQNAGKLNQAKVINTENQKAFKEEIDGIAQTKRETETAFEDKYRALKKASNDEETEVQKYDARITDIDQRREQYDNEDIDQKCHEFEQLDTYIEHQESARERLNGLTAEVKLEQTQYHEKLHKESVRHNKSRSKLEQERADQKQKLSDITEAHNEKRELINKQENQAIYTLLEESQKQQIEITNAITEANTMAKQSGESEDEKLRLAELERIVQERKQSVSAKEGSRAG